MKKLLLAFLLLSTILLSSCADSDNYSGNGDFKFDKETFDAKYDLIFLSYFDFDSEYEHLKEMEEMACKPTDSYKDKSNDLTEITIDGISHKVKRDRKSYYDSYSLQFYDRHYTQYSTVLTDDPISSIYVDDLGNNIIISYNTIDVDLDKVVDIGDEARKKKAEEYLPKFGDPEKYKYDYTVGNYNVFSYFSGDVPTYDNICIGLLDDGTLSIVRHYFEDRFDENSAKPFDNIGAIEEYVKEIFLRETEAADIEVSYFERPVISGYKGETVLLIICELQRTHESYSSYAMGGIIVKPK